MALARMMVVASTAAGDESPDSGLLGRWSFDEGRGVYSANAVDPTGDAELHQASWAKGEFGTALRLTGSDSYAILPAMPQLDGSDAMSLTVWCTGRGPDGIPTFSLRWFRRHAEPIRHRYHALGHLQTAARRRDRG